MSKWLYRFRRTIGPPRRPTNEPQQCVIHWYPTVMGIDSITILIQDYCKGISSGVWILRRARRNKLRDALTLHGRFAEDSFMGPKLRGLPTQKKTIGRLTKWVTHTMLGRRHRQTGQRDEQIGQTDGQTMKKKSSTYSLRDVRMTVVAVVVVAVGFAPIQFPFCST